MNLNDLLVPILVAVLVWLVLREFVCWYLKINRAIALLKSIDQKLNRLPENPTTTSSEQLTGKTQE